ncbi:hypothetical protein [Costertonia aggregata]|uniref:Uncharacterized protein n=1 Tax=Costertonia aggregata TaxID=343403 RepID=A0A7H9ANS9_9FLAO|nr:hypothetical protein [Costertonia aggregata]QLG45102.1 hypothetical protein HYG79_06970 [Costertonia aggregata]
MEDEVVLQELDTLLRPAIERSWRNAKRQTGDADIKPAFLEEFRMALDNTRVDLSRKMYKIDLAMKGSGSLTDQKFWASLPKDVEKKRPKVDADNYVRKTITGHKVWDGWQWRSFSENSRIQVDIVQSAENGNKWAVKVLAKDMDTGAKVAFIDHDVHQPGHDLGYYGRGNDPTATEKKYAYWEDPLYRKIKNGITIGGLTAGTLEMRHVGNLTPWHKGDAFRNADGWYRSKEGVYKQLRNQRMRGAGGHQKGAKRALGKGKVFKSVGKKLFYVGAMVSVFEAGHAYYTTDYNRKEVYAKATVDVVIGMIGTFGGPVGWVVAGSYFILDVSGAFGTWGEPAGMTSEQFSRQWHEKYDPIRNNFGERPAGLDFEMEYCTPMEQRNQEAQLERLMQRDKTRVATPKRIFYKGL